MEECECEARQENEGQDGSEHAKLRNISNISKELSSSDVVAGGKDNQWQQEVKKQFVFPLKNCIVSLVHGFVYHCDHYANDNNDAGLVTPLEHFELHVRADGQIEYQDDADEYVPDELHGVVRYAALVVAARVQLDFGTLGLRKQSVWARDLQGLSDPVFAGVVTRQLRQVR